MMKNIILALSVILCLSCSTKNRSTNSCTDGSCAIPPSQNVITQENWQLSLPGEGWKPVGEPTGTIKIIFNNEQIQTTVLFNKEITSLSFSDYVVRSLHTSQNVGLIVRSLKTTTVSNTRAVLIDITISGKD